MSIKNTLKSNIKIAMQEKKTEELSVFAYGYGGCF